MTQARELSQFLVESWEYNNKKTELGSNMHDYFPSKGPPFPGPLVDFHRCKTIIQSVVDFERNLAHQKVSPSNRSQLLFMVQKSRTTTWDV